MHDGDIVSVGDVDLEVIHLVGHTPGSIALLYDDPTGSPHLWTGDSLFPGGVGKTRSAADFTSLIDDVESKIFERLPDETWVYPATATTRHWAPNVRTSPSGAHAGGSRPSRPR